MDHPVVSSRCASFRNPKNEPTRVLGCVIRLMQSLGGRIMDPWRLATRGQRRINTLAGLALASCVLTWLAGFSSASTGHIGASIENTRAAAIETTSAVTIVERREPAVITSIAPTEPPQKIVLASADISDVV